MKNIYSSEEKVTIIVKYFSNDDVETQMNKKAQGFSNLIVRVLFFIIYKLYNI